MDKMISAKYWFLQSALSYLGTPYVWGGDDPSGFDCSGFVIECLKSAGILNEREDYTAESLRRRFASRVIDKPLEGALLFSLNRAGEACHVVICLDEYFQIGASGRGSQTTGKISAWRDNAYVKIRPIKIRPNQQSLIYLFS